MQGEKTKGDKGKQGPKRRRVGRNGRRRREGDEKEKTGRKRKQGGSKEGTRRKEEGQKQDRRRKQGRRKKKDAKVNDGYGDGCGDGAGGAVWVESGSPRGSEKGELVILFFPSSREFQFCLTFRCVFPKAALDIEQHGQVGRISGTNKRDREVVKNVSGSVV